MSELSDKIRSIADAIQKRATDAQDEKDRKQEERQVARADFEILKANVIRPVLVNASELLAANRIAAQVEERKNVTYQDDHIRLIVEPPKRATYPGASVLLFARGLQEGVDVHCYYRSSNNISENHLQVLHLRSGDVTAERVEQILNQVIGQMIEPATPAQGSSSTAT